MSVHLSNATLLEITCRGTNVLDICLHGNGYLYESILREKSLAICLGDSQFRRNGIFNFMISKIYVDNVYEYDEINRWHFT